MLREREEEKKRSCYFARLIETSMDDGCATQKHCGANVKIGANIYMDPTSVCVRSVGTVSLKLFIRGSTLATLSSFLFFLWIQRVLTIQ
jgi:hypothetical protein